VLGRDRVDQLLDRHRLAHAGAAEDARLAALGHRRDQVDNLHAGLEHFDAGRLILEQRRAGVNRHTHGVSRNRLAQVHRAAKHVEHAAQ
jgi:predicted transcriptional regulator